jgi:hypothetical protein
VEPVPINVVHVPGNPWWQTALTVLAGVGVILGVMVPAVLFLVERRDRQAAEKELSELRSAAALDALAAQARRVHVWVETTGDPPRFLIRCLNSSDLPVFNVESQYVVTLERTGLNPHVEIPPYHESGAEDVSAGVADRGPRLLRRGCRA